MYPIIDVYLHLVDCHDYHQVDLCRFMLRAVGVILTNQAHLPKHLLSGATCPKPQIIGVVSVIIDNNSIAGSLV